MPAISRQISSTQAKEFSVDDISYRHDQATPIVTWTVQHNLGYMPAGLYVEDSAGTTQEPSVHHVDANTVELTFIGATDGFALLT